MLGTVVLLCYPSYNKLLMIIYVIPALHNIYACMHMHVLHACCILASVSSGINYHDYCGVHGFVSTGQKRFHMTKLVAKCQA